MGLMSSGQVPMEHMLLHFFFQEREAECEYIGASELLNRQNMKKIFNGMDVVGMGSILPSHVFLSFHKDEADEVEIFENECKNE